MRLAINIALSLLMLALCLWLVWPSPEHWQDIKTAFADLTMAQFWPYLAGYIALLAATHFFRAWRWNNLLIPIGLRLPPMRLMAISSVGFMAILALPARLGEFVRPALIRQRGKVSVAAALGTVAVERIVDGLLVSIIVFVAFFSLRGPDAPAWMMPTAWAALGVFAAAMVFLSCALKWPDRTVRIAVSLTLARKFSPSVARILEDKLRALISGFQVLDDRANLGVFCGWTVLYWLCNALGILLLARGFGVELSFVGALATMGLTAVGITLPNAPALVGQFQWFMTLGLSLYVGEEVASTNGLAFAIACHGIQVIWYMGVGALSLASRHVSFSEVVASRELTDDEEDVDA